MIKTLLFDFGDVFLSLDKPATVRELQKLGNIKIAGEHFELFRKYEKGMISTKNFLRSLREYFPQIPEDRLIRAWNSILLEFPENRMDFIRKLSAENKFQLILLSNTNELHLEWVAKNIAFFEEFKTCFDACYFSHEINFRKPDPTIFEFILKKHRLKPAQILFVDDTREHIQAAKKLGFHVWNLHPEKEEVTELFDRKSKLFKT